MCLMESQILLKNIKKIYQDLAIAAKMYDKVVICFSNRIIELSLVKSAESLNNELTMLLCPQIFIPFNENSLWSRNSTSPIIK